MKIERLSAALAVGLLMAVSMPVRAADEPVSETIAKARFGPLSARLQSIETLGRVRDPRIIADFKLVDVLLELAKDGNPRIGRSAVSAIGEYPMAVSKDVGDKVVQPIIAIAQDKSLHVLVRRQALQELGRILNSSEFSHRAPINSVTAFANDEREDIEVRIAALASLGSISSPTSKETLRNAIANRNTEIADAALDAYGRCLVGDNAKDFVDSRLAATLIRRMGERETGVEVKKSIVEILARFTSLGEKLSNLERPFIDLLNKESDSGLLKAVIRSLGYVGGADAAAALDSAYGRFSGEAGEQTGVEIRRQICETAGLMFDYWSQTNRAKTMAPVAQKLTQVLIKAAVSDANDGVRREAAVSLGNLYDKGYNRVEAVTALVAVIGVENIAEDFKAAAQDSLEVLTGRSFATPAQWEEWLKRSGHTL